MKKTTNLLLKNRLSQTALFSRVSLLIISVFAMAVGYGANISSTATGGDWNTVTSWVGGVVPVQGDNVTIVSGATVTVSAAVACTNLIISGTLTLANSGISLKIGNPGSNTGSLTLNTGSSLFIGSLNTVEFVATQNGGGIINNGGTIVSTGINGSDGGTIQSDAASGGGFAISGTAQTVFYNLTFISNATFNTSGAPNIVINGTFTIPNNNWAWAGGSLSPIYGSGSTLNINNNGLGYIPGGNRHEWLQFAPGAGIIGVTPGYPNNVILANIGTSESNYNGNQYGAKLSGAWSINGTLQLGTTAVSALVDLDNGGTGTNSFSCGGIIIEPGSKLAGPNAGFLVNGNWSRAGTYINNSSTVTFGGAGPDTISATSGIENSFYSVVVNGATSLNVQLNSSVSLPANGTLNLVSGIITSSSTNQLIVANTSTTAVSGGSAGSYVNGPLAWSLANGTNSYLFPVGAGSGYYPFGLSANNASVNTATVQAFNTASGGTVDGTLSSLSTTEYWSLLTTSALSTGSSVSVTRPTPIAPLSLLGESITTSNGVYTSIGGTAGTYSISNANITGTSTSMFFALGNPPIVSTLAATSITTTGATLNGAFNTMGSSLGTTFSYGTTTSYGTTVNSIHSPINSNSAVADSFILTGLTANTAYHYIASDQVNSGTDVLFITAPNPPVVGTPSNASASGITANWMAPSVPGTAVYTYTVQVSSDPTFSTGVTTQTGISSGTTSYTFTGLNAATTYYYRVEAVNATANSVWSANSSGLSTFIVPTPPCTTGTGSTTSTGSIIKAPYLPVVDGLPDSVWNIVPANNISYVSVGGNTGNTQTWKAMWSTDSLYFLVQVNDPTLISQAAGLVGTSPTIPVGATQSTCTAQPYYGSDGVEIALAPDGVLGNNYNGYNDVQFRFNLGSTVVSGQSSGSATQFSGAIFNSVYQNIDFKIVTTPTGYNVEAAIPLDPGIDSLQGGGYFPPTVGQNIGLEIQVNDATTAGGCRAAQYSWYNGSQNPYQNPSTFAEATYTTCPVPPTVILPTVTGITDSSAILGATVSSSGDAVLTANGTGYTANPNNAGTQNALAASTVVTPPAAYITPQTGLAPQTKYYFLGYANNANNETGISNIDSFYTLSALPTVQPTLSAATCAQIVLNWNSVTFPSADSATNSGYLIIRSVAPAIPTTAGIVTRIATVQSALPAGDTLIATINSGATLTYTDATALTGITYNYLLIPFTWDGNPLDSTYNYFTTGASTVSATTGTSVVPIFTPVAPICSGGTLNALPTTSNNDITGTWLPALNNTTTTTYTFNPTAGQCATTDTLTIVVNPGVTPTFSPVAAICTGGSLSALPTTSTNGISGSWLPALNDTATTTYTFTPTPGQCAASTTLTITVNPLVTPTFNPVAAICSGAALSALPTTSTNGVSGTWLPALNNTATTTYTFTPSAGQCATTDTLTITVNQPVVPTFNPVSTICSGSSLSPLPTTSTNGVSGSWSPGLNNTATTTYTFAPAAGQCATNATLAINVLPLPDVTVSSDPSAPVSPGTSVTLTGTSTIPGSYLWTSTSAEVASPTNLVTTAQPTSTTVYTLNVSTNTDPACVDSASVTVSINNLPCLVQPSRAFTPNGDGIDDRWAIFGGDCVTNLTVNVYNRWGSLVYHSDNYPTTVAAAATSGWDGKYQGNTMPDATYYYVIQATFNNNITYTLTGNVTIIR